MPSDLTFITNESGKSLRDRFGCSGYDFALQKFNELWAKSVDVTKDYVPTIEVKSPFAQFSFRVPFWIYAH